MDALMLTFVDLLLSTCTCSISAADTALDCVHAAEIEGGCLKGVGTESQIGGVLAQ